MTTIELNEEQVELLKVILDKAYKSYKGKVGFETRVMGRYSYSTSFVEASAKVRDDLNNDAEQINSIRKLLKKGD